MDETSKENSSSVTGQPAASKLSEENALLRRRLQAVEEVRLLPGVHRKTAYLIHSAVIPGYDLKFPNIVTQAAADALGELEDYKEKFHGAVAAHDAAHAELRHLMGEIDGLRTLQEETTQLKMDLRERKAQGSKAVEELKALKQKLKEAEVQHDSLKQQLADAIAAKQGEQASLEELRQNLRSEDKPESGAMDNSTGSRNERTLQEELTTRMEALDESYKESLQDAQQRSDDLEAKLQQAHTILEAERILAQRLQQETAERQKRFTAVQIRFKAQIQELEGRIEAAQGEMSAMAARAAKAEAAVAESRALADAACMERDSALKLVERVRMETAEIESSLAASVTLVLGNQMELRKAEALSTTGQEDYYEIAIRDVEERAAATISALNNQLEDVKSQLAIATARTKSVESANADLSRKLACIVASSSKENDLDENKEVGREDSIAGDASKSALRRVEAAEKAATAAYRRATFAEEQVETLKALLENAEKKAKEMAWQVKMLSDSASTEGATQGSRGLQRFGVGMLDVLGCAMNYTRRTP